MSIDPFKNTPPQIDDILKPIEERGAKTISAREFADKMRSDYRNEPNAPLVRERVTPIPQEIAELPEPPVQEDIPQDAAQADPVPEELAIAEEAEPDPEEVEAQELVFASPGKFTEDLLAELSLLSQSSPDPMEQQESPEFYRSTSANKNEVRTPSKESTRGTDTPPRAQSPHLSASAAMKKHIKGEWENGSPRKMQDPSAMQANPRRAPPMEQSASKNWNRIRAEFKQMLQLSLKDPEFLFNGRLMNHPLPANAQGTALGNNKNSSNSMQTPSLSFGFTAAAKNQKAEAFALGLQLLQMCTGKQADERVTATGRTMREEVIAGRIPLSGSIPKDLKEVLTGLLLDTSEEPLTTDEALAMLALSREIPTAQGLPQALFYAAPQTLAGGPRSSAHSHAIAAVAAVPGSTLFLSNSPMDQDASAEEEEEEEGEGQLIRAVVFGSAEIALDAESLIKEMREKKIKVALLTEKASSSDSYDLTAVLERAEWEKPSSKTQLFLAERLAVSAEETLFIAKDATQAASAQALGFNPIIYQSFRQLKQECIKRLFPNQKEH